MGSLVANAAAHHMPDSIRNEIGWTVHGACVGIAQWLVLRKHIRAARFWPPTCAAAWLTGQLLFVPGSSFVYALLTLLTGEARHSLQGPAIGMAVGIGIGVVQWLLLRREVKGCAWWILATALAWALFYIPEDSGPASLTNAIVLGILTGLLTAIILLWRVRKPSSTLESMVRA
jgi:hypothetical protein